MQAGCGGFERRSGKASGQYCYRIETPMTFLLGRNDDYCIHISLPFFTRILQCGLKQQDDENPAGESVPFRDCQEFKEDLEGLQSKKSPNMYMVKVKTEGLSGKELLCARFINELSIQAWLGSSSLSLHEKRKPRYALNCILADEDIQEIIQSGSASRKAAYKQRREARKKQEAGEQQNKADGQNDQ